MVFAQRPVAVTMPIGIFSLFFPSLFFLFSLSSFRFVFVLGGGGGGGVFGGVCVSGIFFSFHSFVSRRWWVGG